MLVTLLVLCYVRPMLRSPTRRRRAVSIILIAASVIAGDGRLQVAQAQDRFSESARPESTESRADGEELSSLFGRQQSLREGTVIPPTVGRVVNLGRRWAFVPIEENLVAHHGGSIRPFASHESPLKSPSRDKGHHSRLILSRGIHLGWESDSTVLSREAGGEFGNLERDRLGTEALT